MIDAGVMIENAATRDISYNIIGNTFTQGVGYAYALSYGDIISTFRVRNATGIIKIEGNTFVDSYVGRILYALLTSGTDAYLGSAIKILFNYNHIRLNGGTGLNTEDTAGIVTKIGNTLVGVTPAGGTDFDSFITWFRGTAAPTTGTYLRGSVCLHSSPATGQPMGWICSTAGTPGTWKPLPNVL